MLGVVLVFILASWPSVECKADEWKPKIAAQESSSGDESVLIYSASYALVIGIDAYSAGWPRLVNAVRDAKEVASALESIGFDVDLQTNLTSNELAPTIKRFFVSKGRDNNARLLLWYAGHGHTIQGEGFLVPADAPLDSDPEFKLKALHMRDFGSYVRLAESKHALAIFDSCFSGTIFDAPRAAPPSSITWATARPVRQFLSSGDANQTVLDDGTFRKVFVDALRGIEPADSNRDGYLTASELGLFMTDRILNLTQGRQTPRFGKLRDRDWDQGDFVIAVPGNSSAVGPGRPALSGDALSGSQEARTKGIVAIRLATPAKPAGILSAPLAPAPVRRPAKAKSRPPPRAKPKPRPKSMTELVEQARARQAANRKNKLIDQSLKADERTSRATSCKSNCRRRYQNVERERNWVSERNACDSAEHHWDQCVEGVKATFRQRLIAECDAKC